MKIEVIPPMECPDCKSCELDQIGYRKVEGYLCKKCHTYFERNGFKRKVKRIARLTKRYLFKSELRFQ